MLRLLLPPDRKVEFFGLWSFASHLAVGVGPLTYGLITLRTGVNHRVAILSISLFFVGGLWLLMPINMAHGQQSAHDTT